MVSVGDFNPSSDQDNYYENGGNEYSERQTDAYSEGRNGYDQRRIGTFSREQATKTRYQEVGDTYGGQTEVVVPASNFALVGLPTSTTTVGIPAGQIMLGSTLLGNGLYRPAVSRLGGVAAIERVAPLGSALLSTSDNWQIPAIVLPGSSITQSSGFGVALTPTVAPLATSAGFSFVGNQPAQMTTLLPTGSMPILLGNKLIYY